MELKILIRRLATQEHSAALTQPASRISTIMKKFDAGTGDDPLVKGLISDLSSPASRCTVGIPQGNGLYEGLDWI